MEDIYNFLRFVRSINQSWIDTIESVTTVQLTMRFTGNLQRLLSAATEGLFLRHFTFSQKLQSFYNF